MPGPELNILDRTELPDEIKANARKDVNVNLEVFEKLKKENKYSGNWDDFKKETLEKDVYNLQKESLFQEQFSRRDLLLKEKESEIQNNSKGFYENSTKGKYLESKLKEYDGLDSDYARFKVDQDDLKEYESIYNKENVTQEEVEKLRNDLNAKYGIAGDYAFDKIQRKSFDKIYEKAKENNYSYRYTAQSLVENKEKFETERAEKAMAQLKEELSPEKIKEIEAKILEEVSPLVEEYRNNAHKYTDTEKKYYKKIIENKIDDIFNDYQEKRYLELYQNTTYLPKKVTDKLDQVVTMLNESQKNGTSTYQERKDDLIKAIGEAAKFLPEEERLKYFGDDKKVFIRDENGDFTLNPEYQENVAERKGYQDDFFQRALVYMGLDKGLYIGADGLTPDGIRANVSFLNSLRHEMGKNGWPGYDELHDEEADENLPMTEDQVKNMRLISNLSKKVRDKTEKGEGIKAAIKKGIFGAELMPEFEAAYALRHIGEKLKKGETLTVDEEILGQMLGMETELYSKEETNLWGDIASGVVAMGPYMAGYAASKKIIDLATRGSLKHVGKAAGQNFAKEATKAMLKRQAGNFGKFVLRTSLQAAINPQMYIPEYNKRFFTLGTMLDEKGNVIPTITKEQSRSKAILDAAATTYFEIASEELGDVLIAGPKKGYNALKNKLFKPESTNKIIKAFRKINNNSFINGFKPYSPWATVKGKDGFVQMNNNFMKDVLGFHGMAPEYLEELANSRLTNLFTGDIENENRYIPKYADRVLYWNGRDELVTAGTVAAFSLLATPTMTAFNRLAKPSQKLRYVDNNGSLRERKIKGNVARLVWDSYNEKEGTFDRGVIEELYKHKHITAEEKEAILQNVAAEEYREAERRETPNREAELLEMGYTKNDLKGVALNDRIQYSILKEYKDLYDAGLLNINSSNRYEVPSSIEIESKISDLSLKIKGLEDVKKNVEELEQNDAEKLDAYKSQLSILQNVLNGINEKRAAKEEKRFESLKVHGLATKKVDGTIEFSDLDSFIVKKKELSEMLDEMEDDINEENKEQFEKLGEDYNLIDGMVWATISDFEREMFGDKKPNMEMMENATKETKKYLEEKRATYEEKKNEFAVTAINEFIDLLDQRIERIEEERKTMGGNISVEMEEEETENTAENLDENPNIEKQTEKLSVEEKTNELESKKKQGKYESTFEEVIISDLLGYEYDENGDVEDAKKKDVETYSLKIKEGSSIPPILVERKSDGKLYIIDGHRRVLAARENGITSVKAVVRHVSSGDTKYILPYEVALIKNGVQTGKFDELMEKHEALKNRKGKKLTVSDKKDEEKNISFYKKKIAERAQRSKNQLNSAKKEIEEEFGKDFRKKIHDSISDEVDSRLDKEFVTEQRKIDKKFDELMEKHEALKNRKGKITQGQVEAINVLTHTGILSKKEYGDINQLSVSEASDYINKAVKRIQYIKTNQAGMAESSAKLQSRIFSLMSLASVSNRHNQDLLMTQSKGNLDKSKIKMAIKTTEEQVKKANDILNETKEKIDEAKRNLDITEAQRKAEIRKLNYRLGKQQDFIDELSDRLGFLTETSKEIQEREKEKKVTNENQKTEEQEKKEDIPVDEVKEFREGIEQLEKELYASDKNEEAPEMSVTFPSVRLANMKIMFETIKEGINSGQDSFEKIAIETIRLLRSKASKNMEFMIDEPLIEDIVMSLLTGNFTAKNEQQKKVVERFERFRNKMEEKAKDILNERVRNSGSVMTSSDQRIAEQRNNLSSLFKVVAEHNDISKDEFELQFFQQAKDGLFSKVTNEKEYLKLLLDLEEVQDNDEFAERLLYGIYENNVSFSEFMSYRNFYENLYIVRNEGVKFDYSSKKKKYEVKHLNPRETSANLSKTANTTINNYTLEYKSGEKLNNEDSLRQWANDFVGKMDSMVSKQTPNEKRRMFEMEMDFIQEITGISKDIWKNFYVLDNDKGENIVYLKVIFEDGTNGFVKAHFNGYESVLDFQSENGNRSLNELEKVGISKIEGKKKVKEFTDSRAFYQQKKGSGVTYWTSNSTRLMGTLVGNIKSSRNRDRNNYNAKTIIKDFLFKGDKTKKTKSNIEKLGLSKSIETESWMAGKDFNGKRFSGFVLSNHMFTALENQEKNPTVELSKKMKELGLPMNVTIQRGVRGYQYDEGKELSNVIDNDSIASKDFWMSQMQYFISGDKTYNALAGQFGDKDAMYYVSVPKEKYRGTKEQKAKIEKLNINLEKIADEFYGKFGREIKFVFDIESEDNVKRFINSFLYNFITNTEQLSEIINGKYNKENYKDFVDLVKRGAPVISPGYRLADMDDGVGKTYTHMVINDPTAIGLNENAFEIPNGIQIISSEFAKKIHRNMGSVYGRQKELGNTLTSTKALHSAVSEDGVRSLTKANVVNAEVFLKTFGEKYKPLIDLMNPVYDEKGNLIRKGIDSISFDSGTKKNEHKVTDSVFAHEKGSLSLFDDKMNLKEVPNEELDKFIFERSKNDFYIQQDLRHKPKVKGTTLPNQFRTNILPIQGSEAFIELMNQQIDEMFNDLEDEFNGLKTYKDKQKFVLSLISKGFFTTNSENQEEEDISDEYEVKDIKDLTGENLLVAEKLLSGASLNDIFIRSIIKKKMLLYIEKNGLLMYGNRQTTEAIPDVFNQLKGFVSIIYKGKERMRLPQIAANIPGARYPEKTKFKEMKDVVKHILENKGKYLDLIDNNGNVREWEIEEGKNEKGENIYIIPGEVIISSRVPGDDLHSHTMARLTIKTLGSFTALNQQVSEASGEDYDGDQRYNQCFFRTKYGNIINDNSKEGLSNMSILAIIDGYLDPKNTKILTNPINTEKYDSIIKKIVSIIEKRENSKKGSESTVAFSPATIEESRKNNMTGIKMKGIVSNLSTVYSYLKLINPNVNKSSIFNVPLYDQNDTQQGVVTLSGIANDDFNIIKAHIGYLLNLAFDNAKDPKIEKMGFNEVTANMFVFMLINDKSLDSKNFKDRFSHDIAVTKRIGNISVLFNRDVFREFTRLNRELQSSNIFKTATEIQNEALEIIKNKYSSVKEYNKDIIALESLLKASTDLWLIKSVQKYTEKVPRSFEEYVLAKNYLDRLMNNKMSFYQADKFLSENEDEELTSILSNSEKSLNSSYEFVFEGDLESSDLTNFVMEEIRLILKDENAIEANVKFDQNTIKEIISNIEVFAGLLATGTKRKFFEVSKETIKQIEEAKASDPNNKFLQMVSVETDIEQNTEGYEEIKRRVSVISSFRQSEYPLEEMEAIRNDFDKLDNKLKDDLFEYMLYVYGNKTMATSGTYYQFMSNSFLNSKSAKIDELTEKWNNNIYDDYSLETLGNVVKDNLKSLMSKKRYKTFDVSKAERMSKQVTPDNIPEVVQQFKLNDYVKLNSVKSMAEFNQVILEMGYEPMEFVNSVKIFFARNKIQYEKGKALKKFIEIMPSLVPEISMNKKMSKEDNIYGRNTTTAKEVENGNRIATTRSYPVGLGMQENKALANELAPGRVVRFEGVNGLFVIESVEKLTKKNTSDPAWVERWSQKEGWTTNYFKKVFKKTNTVKIGSYQTTFRKIDESELKVSKPNVNKTTKVNNELPKEFHGKVVYATSNTGKSTFINGKAGLIDCDDLIMEVLDELGYDYKEKDSNSTINDSFGIVSWMNSDIVWPILRDKINRLKNQGYTIFTSNFYFNQPEFDGNEVDFVMLEKDPSRIVKRSEEREGRDPIKFKKAQDLINKETKYFEGKKFGNSLSEGNFIYLNGNMMSDVLSEKRTEKTGLLNPLFSKVTVESEKGLRTKTITVKEAAGTLKGIDDYTDKLINSLLKKHPDSKIVLHLDQKSPKEGKVAMMDGNTIHFYKESVSPKFDYYLKHELTHLHTKERINTDSAFRNSLKKFMNEASIALGKKNIPELNNVHEFLADFLTDVDFKESLPSDLINKINSFLGLKTPNLEVRNQLVSSNAQEALMSNDPILAGYILDHFTKLYPEVAFFKDRDAFERFCENGAKRGLVFDREAIGHAFGNAVFIDKNRALQSTIFHEYAHIYWDALPETNRIKKELRNLFSDKGKTQDEIDEHIILEIGKIGTSMAKVSLNQSKLEKFIELLKKFWNEVVKLFSNAPQSEQELLESISKAIWNRKPDIDDRFNQRVLRNHLVESPDSFEYKTFGENGESYYFVDPITKRKLKSATGIKKMLSPGEFQFKRMAELKVRSEVSKAISEKEIQDRIKNKILEYQSAGKHGTKMHKLAQLVFDGDYEEIKKTLSYKNATFNYEQEELDMLYDFVNQLEALKRNIQKMYPNCKFHTEKKFGSPSLGIAGIIDLIIEKEDGKLIICDFKTLDTRYEDTSEENYGKLKLTEIRKSLGRFSFPLVNVNNSKENQFKIQLMLYKKLVESQEDHSGKKNEVEMMMIIPIFRDIHITSIENQEGKKEKRSYVDNVHIGKYSTFTGNKSALDNKRIETLLDFTKKLEEKEDDAIRNELEKNLGDKWDKFSINEAFNAVNSLSSMLDKDLSQITADDVLQMQSKGVYGLMQQLEEEYEFDYEDFFDGKDENGKVRKALPFEQMVFSLQFQKNKKESSAAMKDDVVESVEEKKSIYQYKDGVKRKPGIQVFYKDGEHIVMEEIGKKQCYSDGKNQPKINIGDRIAEAYFYEIKDKLEKSIKIGEVVNVIVSNNLKKVVLEVKFEGEKETTMVPVLNDNAGILKVVEKNDVNYKKKIGKNIFIKNNDSFEPVYVNSEIVTTGTHMDVSIPSPNDPKEVRHIERSLRILRKLYNDMFTIESFQKALQDDPDKLLKLYRLTSQLHPSVVSGINLIFQETLWAHHIAEKVRKENTDTIKTYPKVTSELYSMVAEGEGIFSHTFDSHTIVDLVSPREMREEFTPINNITGMVETAYNKAFFETKEFSNDLKYFMKLFDNDWSLLVHVDPKSKKRSFRRPSEFKSHQVNEKKFSEWLYKKYEEKGIIDKDDIIRIPVPNQYILKKEFMDIKRGKKGLWSSPIFMSYSSRKAYSLLAPAPWDNELIEVQEIKDEDGNPVEMTLAQLKKYYAEQFQSTKNLKLIYKGLTNAVIKKFKSNPLVAKTLVDYEKEAKNSYHNNIGKNKKPYRLSSHNGPVTSMNTSHVFEALEVSTNKMISNYYMEKVVPGVHHILNKYEHYGNKKMYRWLKDWTDMVVFGKLPEGQNEFASHVVDFVQRLNSLRAMAFSVKTQAVNLTVGHINNMIFEPDATRKGWARLRHGMKAFNIMNNQGVVNIVSDAQLDQLEKDTKKLLEYGYAMMEGAEKMIQAVLFSGLLTEEQWDAYDNKGFIKEGREKDALNELQISMIKERISQIHGDYSKIYSAPGMFKIWGKLVFPFRKWVLTSFDLFFQKYRLNRNSQIDVGAFTAFANYLGRSIMQYNILPENKRIELAKKYQQEFTEEQIKAEKKYGHVMKENHFKSNSDYFKMMVRQANGEKITWKSMPGNEKKAIRAGLIYAATIMMASMAVMGGDDDNFWDGPVENILEALMLMIVSDVGVMTDISGFDDILMRGIGSVAPPLGYLEDTFIFVEELYHYFMYIKNEKIGDDYYPRAFYDEENAYHRKGEARVINAFLKIIPAGSLIRQARQLGYMIFNKELIKEKEAEKNFNYMLDYQKAMGYETVSDEALLKEKEGQLIEDAAYREFYKKFFEGMTEKEKEEFLKMKDEERVEKFERRMKRLNQKSKINESFKK